MSKELIVKKLPRDFKIDANWEKWSAISSEIIDNNMGEEPDFRPTTNFKIGYTDDALIVIFKVEDKNIVAKAQTWHGEVWLDSCVEFFFAPQNTLGYINVETNCGGTMLFKHQTAPQQNLRPLSLASCEKIEIAHTLPKIIENEITEPTEWILEYKIPYDAIREMIDFDIPKSGDVWNGNFYKCADLCSAPHWLTWSLIPQEKPNFHVPSAFGKLIFE